MSPAPRSSAVPAALIASATLAGVVDGTVTVRSSPRAPTIERIDAAGTLAGHGAVKVSATLRVGRTGVDSAPIVGLLRLEEAGGTLTLRVRGTRFLGGVRPDDLSYMILGGTSRDRGARGTGGIALTEAYAPGTLTLSTASLYFNPGPIPLPLDGVIRGQELQISQGLAGGGTYVGRGVASVPAVLRESFAMPGQTVDTLILNDARGTLTLSLAPRPDGIFDTTYTIVSGTGVYGRFSGSGPASVHRGGPNIYGGPFGGPGTLSFRYLVVLGDGGGQSMAPPQ